MRSLFAILLVIGLFLSQVSWAAEQDPSQMTLGQLKAAVGRDPENYRYQLHYAIKMTAGGKNLEEAIPHLTKAIQLEPRSHKSHWFLGVVLIKLKRYDHAIPMLDKATQLKPDIAEPYGCLGDAYSNLGHYERAISCYQEGLKRNPKYAEALFSLGRTYLLLALKAENHEEAVKKHSFCQEVMQKLMVLDLRLNIQLIGMANEVADKLNAKFGAVAPESKQSKY